MSSRSRARSLRRRADEIARRQPIRPAVLRRLMDELREHGQVTGPAAEVLFAARTVNALREMQRVSAYRDFPKEVAVAKKLSEFIGEARLQDVAEGFELPDGSVTHDTATIVAALEAGQGDA